MAPLLQGPIKENKLTSAQIEFERISMFNLMSSQLLKEEEQLVEHFNIARNLACSTWNVNMQLISMPNRMHPERMDLLHENYNALRIEISRKRCYIVEMAIAYLGMKKARSFINGDCWAAYDYWHKELK